MDEKHLERGLYQPPSFSPDLLAKLAFALLPSPNSVQALLLSLLSFFACIQAFATSFGPLPLTAQMENAPYIYQGKIRGRWVEIEKNSQKPYTYWNLIDVEILKAPGNENLRELILRQPGGEVGDLGYRVAGSADFNDGEEVIVFAKGTDLPNVREVMSLAAGKYAVENDPKGNTVLRNGIGFTTTDAGGSPLSVEDFRQILTRVKQGASTEADKKIIFNVQGGTHENDEPHTFPDQSAKLDYSNTNSTSPSQNSTNSPPNPVQKDEKAPDMSSSGLREERSTILVFVSIAVAAFLAGILWIVLRRK